MYSDYYFPNLSEHDYEMDRLHNEHCFDLLRQWGMCHRDIGLITFEGHENGRDPVANATTHHCVNWEKLDGWTEQRSVDMMKSGWLVHPTKGERKGHNFKSYKAASNVYLDALGVASRDGKGDNIGAAEAPHIHSSRDVPALKVTLNMRQD